MVSFTGRMLNSVCDSSSCRFTELDVVGGSSSEISARSFRSGDFQDPNGRAARADEGISYSFLAIFELFPIISDDFRFF